MKFYQVVVLVVASLTFLVVGSFLLGIGLNIYAKEDVLEEIGALYHYRWITLLVAAFFLVMGYYASIKYLIKGLFREDGMLFYGPGRENAISFVALEDLVRKAVKKFYDVKHCRVRIRTVNKKTQVWISLRLWVGLSVAELVNQIRVELQSKFHSILGTDNQPEFIIRVVKVEERQQRELGFAQPSRNVKK